MSFFNSPLAVRSAWIELSWESGLLNFVLGKAKSSC
jgi:hypothetical protein